MKPTKNRRGFECQRRHISALFPDQERRGKTFSATVRARTVNGYDDLLLSTTEVRDEGRETRKSLYEVDEKVSGGLPNISCVDPIVLLTELHCSHVAW